MTNLPPDFPAQDLAAAAPADLHLLEDFCRRFAGQGAYGQGHFVLACYAAFPVVITPDLLYKLWMNFGKYRNAAGERVHINAVAVSDLLLSPLFTLVQDDIYRMSGPVRNACLRYLRQVHSEGPNPQELHTLDELAYFLLHYLQRQYTAETPAARAFREAQEWAALAYLRPELAIHRLTGAFRQEGHSTDSRLRLALALQQLVEQERATRTEHDERSFEAFATFSEGWREYLAGNRINAMEHFRQAQGALMTMPVPRIVHDALAEKPPTPKDTRLHALLIAIDRYEQTPLQSCVSDARYLRQYLEQYHTPQSIHELFDDQATRAQVLAQLGNVIKNAGPDDIVLIYFAGHGQNMTQGPFMQQKLNLSEQAMQQRSGVGLVCVDFNQQQTGSSGVVTEADFARVVQENNRSNPAIVLILDTNAGTQRWLDMRNDQHVILTGCRLDQQAHELKIDDQQRGAFTYALVEELTRAGGVSTYRRLFREVQRNVQLRVRQNPQLFGSPRAANRLFLSARNSEVPRLQELLRECGYYNGPVDGHHGPVTANAMQRFRRQYSLGEHADLLAALERKVLVKNREEVDIVLLGQADSPLARQLLEAGKHFTRAALDIQPPDDPGQSSSMR